MFTSKRTVILTLAFAALSACGDASGPDMPEPIEPGFGTAVVDGVVNDTEWANAQTFNVFENDPALVGSVLYVLNDATNMYFGVRTPAGDLDQAGFIIRFDSDGDGEVSLGDDRIALNTVQFSDDHWGGNGFVKDVQQDGAGAIAMVDGVVHAEVVHPLSSNDGQDVSYAPGQQISVCLRFFLAATNASTPHNCVLVNNPSFLDITLAPAP